MTLGSEINSDGPQNLGGKTVGKGDIQNGKYDRISWLRVGLNWLVIFAAVSCGVEAPACYGTSRCHHQYHSLVPVRGCS